MNEELQQNEQPEGHYLTKEDIEDINRNWMSYGLDTPYMVHFDGTDGNEYVMDIHKPLPPEVAKVYPGDTSAFPQPSPIPVWNTDRKAYFAEGMKAEKWGRRIADMDRSELIAFIGFLFVLANEDQVAIDDNGAEKDAH